MTTVSDFSCCLNQCNNSRPIIIQMQSWLNAGTTTPLPPFLWLKPVHFQVQGWKIEKHHGKLGTFYFIFFYFCARKFVSPSIQLHDAIMLRKWHYLTSSHLKLDCQEENTSPGKKIDLFHVLSICWWAQDNEKIPASRIFLAINCSLVGSKQ